MAEPAQGSRYHRAAPPPRVSLTIPSSANPTHPAVTSNEGPGRSCAAARLAMGTASRPEAKSTALNRRRTTRPSAIGPPTETRHPSPLTLAAISLLRRDAKSLGEPAGETIAIRVIESRMRVHQPVHRRGHCAFEELLGGVGRLLLGSLPFGEVQHSSA